MCSPQHMLPETNYYLSTNNLNEGTVRAAPAIHLFAFGEAGYAGRNLFKPATQGTLLDHLLRE